MSENNLPGVVTGGSGKTIYWSVFGNGKVVRKANKGEAGAILRTNKKGVEVWEIHERGISGIIRDINLHETEFGQQLVVKLIPAPGFFYVLNIPKDSRYWGSFLEKLPNINVKEAVEISPYNFVDEKDKEKKVIGISIKQGGQKIEGAYKKKVGDKFEYELGYPPFPAKWHELKERDQKNYFYDVEEFLENELQRWREENNTASANATDYQAIADKAVAPKKNEKVYGTVPSDPNLDQLPF